MTERPATDLHLPTPVWRHSGTGVLGAYVRFIRYRATATTTLKLVPPFRYDLHHRAKEFARRDHLTLLGDPEDDDWRFVDARHTVWLTWNPCSGAYQLADGRAGHCHGLRDLCENASILAHLASLPAEADLPAQQRQRVRTETAKQRRRR